MSIRFGDPDATWRQYRLLQYPVVFDDEDTPYKAIVRDGELVKILGQGKLKKKLVVQVQAASKSAQDAIIKAGGSFEVVALPLRPKAGAKTTEPTEKAVPAKPAEKKPAAKKPAAKKPAAKKPAAKKPTSKAKPAAAKKSTTK